MNNIPKISIIIPFKFNNKKHIADRAYELIQNNYPDSYQVIFVDCSESINIKNKSLCVGNKKYIHSPQKDIFCLAQARNIGAKHATGKFLFFLDVDFIWHELFLQHLEEKSVEITKLKTNFIIIPCVFINKETTELINRNRSLEIFHLIRHDILMGNLQYTETIAIVSSTILVKKEIFDQIGGFNENYIGYGCEEFDFLDKLTRLTPIGIIHDDYFTNEVEPLPVNYKGFRKYFLYYSLPVFFTDLFLIHRYHTKPSFDKFYTQRPKNNKKLLENMKLNQCELMVDKTLLELPSLRNFIQITQENYGYPIKKYPGLCSTDNKKNNKKGSFIKRIRKLIRDPKKYFKDAKRQQKKI